MNRNNSIGFFLPGLLIALGLSVAGYFVSQTLYNAKVALNTAEAKGLAERRVISDRVNWKVLFTLTGAQRSDIPALYEEAEKNQSIIFELLKSNGFDESEIKIGILQYDYLEYRDDQQKLVDESHSLVGSLSVESDKVELVSKVRASINKLMAQGINITNLDPAYRFTRLNEIKPDMLREATTNARLAANEFAVNAGVNVGGIRSARQGSFYVRDAGEEYGDTNKIEKDVRVVTTIVFFLTE